MAAACEDAASKRRQHALLRAASKPLRHAASIMCAAGRTAHDARRAALAEQRAACSGARLVKGPPGINNLVDVEILNHGPRYMDLAEQPRGTTERNNREEQPARLFRAAIFIGGRGKAWA